MTMPCKNDNPPPEPNSSVNQAKTVQFQLPHNLKTSRIDAKKRNPTISRNPPSRRRKKTKRSINDLLGRMEAYMPKPNQNVETSTPPNKTNSDELYTLFSKCSRDSQRKIMDDFKKNNINASATLSTAQAAERNVSIVVQPEKNLVFLHGRARSIPNRTNELQFRTGDAPGHQIYEQNIFSHLRYRTLQAVPSKETNVFLLLSKYGSDLEEALFVAEKKVKWSSKQHWYFCGVLSNGYPWDLSTLPKLKVTAKALLRYAGKDITDKDRKQKLMDIQVVRNITGFLDVEWDVYKTMRFETLRFLGAHALEKRTKQEGKYISLTSLHPFQGLKWQNNSCAFDAFLSILPHLAVSLIKSGVCNRKMLGFNALCHTPVAKLVTAFEVLESSAASPAMVSNWIRHMALDVLRDACLRDARNIAKRRISWSAFSSCNAFCDIGELYGLTRFFFCNTLSFSASHEYLKTFEIPCSYLYEVAHETFSSRSTDPMSFAQILFQTLVSFAKCQQKETFDIVDGLYIFSSYFTSTDSESTRFQNWFSGLCQTDWECTLSLPEDVSRSPSKPKWKLRLLALTSVSSNVSRHFVSASCVYQPERYLLYHDGMRAGGFVRKLDISTVMEHHMNMRHAFFTASVQAI